VKKNGCELPTLRESRRRRKAQATIKYSLVVELGYGTRQGGTLPDEQVMGFQF
jgi:hypothetical protein